MSENRKKLGVVFWATVVLVVVLIGYPISFGPVCWLSDRHFIPDTLPHAIYTPLARLLANYYSDRICDFATDYGLWASGDPGFPAALMLMGNERTRVWNIAHHDERVRNFTAIAEKGGLRWIESEKTWALQTEEGTFKFDSVGMQLPSEIR